MAGFIIKIIIASIVIVGFIIVRLKNFQWSMESITAVGTLLTGIAALLAVFGSFYTMQHQVKKTVHADWLKLFRMEAANMLTLSQKLEHNSNKSEVSEYTKSSMSLMLLLSQTSPNHQRLEESIKNFTIFILTSNHQDQNYQTYFAKNWNSVLALIKIIISEEEKNR